MVVQDRSAVLPEMLIELVLCLPNVLTVAVVALEILIMIKCG